MQIVIDISENDYRKVQDGRASVSMMLKAIRNGTPLPNSFARALDPEWQEAHAKMGFYSPMYELEKALGEVGESE